MRSASNYDGFLRDDSMGPAQLIMQIYVEYEGFTLHSALFGLVIEWGPLFLGTQ